MNLARNAVAAGDYASAETWTDRVVKNATKLPDSHDKAYDLLGAGQTCNEIFFVGA